MSRLPPLSEAERAELRRLWLAALRGTWTAPREQAHPGGVFAVLPDGTRKCVGGMFGPEISDLVAASRNALPRLFAEIDDLRREARPRWPVYVVGTVR